MTLTEFTSQLNTLMADTATITPATFRTLLGNLATQAWGASEAHHTEAASGELVADVATDIYFDAAFANTDYALCYNAVDATNAKVYCTIVKHTDHITVTAAESDCTFDFIAALATIDMNPT